ncbi:MAG: FAD-dependent oxidoreductase [Rhodospirillales bacterium]|nr:FAD-dependent oxidoreductase [Rhodospirillales bacterium]
MIKKLNVDMCIIGAGSGGLSVAAGAAQMGASTVLIEKHKMGGDCLNYGCVPSKALLAAGHAAQAVRASNNFGIQASIEKIDPDGVYGHIRRTIATIEPNDSVERFQSLGVQVIEAAAQMAGPQQVIAGDTLITARRIVIATGSRAFIPPIPGIADVPHLTNETVFDLDRIPSHLIVIGGGPIGIELAQAHQHLGSDVSVLEMFKIMPKDDPELVDVVRQQIIDDGVKLLEGVEVIRLEKSSGRVRVVFSKDGTEQSIDGSHLLVAAGRRPNVDGLELEKAGIIYTDKGIDVDARLRTSNRKVFAIGDVAGGLQFTHVAGYHAGVVIKNALFRLPAKADHRFVPWVTYTSPELSQVGLNERDARKKYGDTIKVLCWPYAENDRAQAEGAPRGMIKVITTYKGKILGCGIVGRQASELIPLWVVALTKAMKIGDIAQMIAPYPSLSEISKRAASSYYTSSLFSEKTRKIVRFLSWFG